VEPEEQPVSTRGRGLLLFLFGVVIGGPIIYGLQLYLERFEHGFGFLVFLGVVPVMVGLIGLFELVTGIPFNQMEERWDKLKVWQRGAVVILLVVVAIVVGTLFITAYF